MAEWRLVDCVLEPSGGELELWRRDDEYAMRINGEDLMGSLCSYSEQMLARLGCEALVDTPQAHVLVGGMGMGFTLRAALDCLGPRARVDVVELVPAVIAWNRGPLAHLAASPLDDPRVRILEGDVGRVIATARDEYDVILLDVDNGPDAFSSRVNRRLYGWAGIARAARALRRQGVLAVWSAYDDYRFTARLRFVGFDTQTKKVSARPNDGPLHTLWFAARS
jgi:spermidine synthase